jgi:hypothetical protein
MSGKGPEFPKVVHIVKSLASSSGNLRTLFTALAVRLPREICIMAANGMSRSMDLGRPVLAPEEALARVPATLHNKKHG